MKDNGHWQGILIIGDPHIAGRAPEFRSDDYSNAILAKLQWCMCYAAEHRLLPVLLGDLFDRPRDNPTWVIGRLIDIMRDQKAIGIYGNHDCAQPQLTDDDSLSILVKSGCLTLVSQSQPWIGWIGDRPAIIGGSSYRERVPDCIDLSVIPRTSLFDGRPFVVWLTHHDVETPGYDGGRFAPFEIGNVDVLINGHIHTRSDPVQKGRTLWLTPGNISRRSRSENCRSQKPAVLRITIDDHHPQFTYVEVPHQNFDDVFHAPLLDVESQDDSSMFVTGLSELRHRRTSSGAGLMEFLRRNVEQFPEPVGNEIMKLAMQVTTEIGQERNDG